MLHSTRTRSWLLLIVLLAIVIAWPPDNDRSLLMKAVNWAVDPGNALPTLPPQLGMGMGDDPIAVEERDAQVRAYDTLQNRGGWMRRRLELKVATDPFNKSTTRQLLLACGIVAAFIAWRARSS
jgi:hypothetical protein